MKRFNVDVKKNQINKFDQRFYEIREPLGKDKWKINILVNLTEILSTYPKGKHFEEWLKSNGFNADLLKEQSANEGSQVHDLIERTLKGEQVSFTNNIGEALYPVVVWEKYLAFCDWFIKNKPKILKVEDIGYSLEFRYAFTMDFLCEINGGICLVDFKTGNYIAETVEYQLIAEAFPIVNELKLVDKIDRLICVHLNWQKNRTNGFKEIDYKMTNESYEFFLNLYSIWQKANSRRKPKYLLYPNSVDLKLLQKFKGDSVIANKYPEEEMIDETKIKTNRTVKAGKKK